jgi:hypothetical protein
MTDLHQLVGIIEIDTDSRSETDLDGTIGETLKSLRNPTRPDVEDAARTDVPEWDGDDPDHYRAIHVLKADLLQIHSDLETELARLLDQLLNSG